MLLTAGWTLALLAAIFVFLGALWPRLGPLVVVFGVSSAFLILAAPAYLFSALPGVLQAEGMSFVNGFFGSSSASGFSYTYGGGVGWYLAFVTFPFLLIATVVAFRAIRMNVSMGNVRFGAAPEP